MLLCVTYTKHINIAKGVAKFHDKYCFGQKSKNTRTTIQKSKHKNLCQSRDLNPGPLAPQSDALPLDHRDS